MNPSKSFLANLGLSNPEDLPASTAVGSDPAASTPAPATSGEGRRSFLKKSALGGLSLSGLFFAGIEDTFAHSSSKVNRYSGPSDLKITDLRVMVMRGVPMTSPIIRIDKIGRASCRERVYGLV